MEIPCHCLLLAKLHPILSTGSEGLALHNTVIQKIVLSHLEPTRKHRFKTLAYMDRRVVLPPGSLCRSKSTGASV
jgi:hypothetical protein